MGTTHPVFHCCVSVCPSLSPDMSSKTFLSTAEDVADQVTKLAKPVLPHLARIFLVSTFLEDGVRMWTHWTEQREYVMLMWGISHFFGSIFVFINLVGQLSAVAMVVNRFKVDLACGILIFIIALQSIAFCIVLDFLFFLRHLALCGAVFLVAVESWTEDKSTFAGVPSMGEDKRPKMYLQLAGRVLLAFMFLTLLRFESKPVEILYTTITSVLMGLITVGYKTKLSALVLIGFLLIHNVSHNCFWTIAPGRPLRDYLKYDFFQTFSFVGGLLMVVVIGPGEVSMDAKKKL